MNCKICNVTIPVDSEVELCPSCQMYIKPAQKYFRRYDIDVVVLVQMYKEHMMGRKDRRKNHGRNKSS